MTKDANHPKRVTQSLRQAPRWSRIVLLVTFVYTGSYFWLSRRGMREAPLYGIDGFLYIPCAEAMRTKNVSRHDLLRLVFAPINGLDHLLIGTDKPVECLMWLSE